MILEEIRKLARQQKIKYYQQYTKNDLAKLLNLAIEPTTRIKSCVKRPICLTNIESGEKMICKSIYKCAQFLNKNLGSINHYLKTGHVLKLNHQSYTLSYV